MRNLAVLPQEMQWWKKIFFSESNIRSQDKMPTQRGCPATLCHTLQNGIPDLIPSQKYHVKMGPICNRYKDMGL
jgi:hypothetical protein